jgi:4-amino-4-deoxy-L-arabinose transferase
MQFINGNIGTFIFLAISILALIFSVILLRKSRIGFSLFFLIIAGLLLRIWISSDQYLHPHDEKYHALVAKNIIQHPLKPTLYENPIHEVDYKDWSCNNVWLHKQPMPLWTIALSISIFGNNEFAVRIPSILFSTLAIWLIYQMSLFFFPNGKKHTTAWIAAFLMAINGLLLELTGGRIATDHYDVFFMFFILVAIYFSTQHIKTKRPVLPILIGLFIGLAVLTKWLPALIVIPVWFLIAIESKKFTKREISLNLLVITSIAIAVFLPWQLYIHSHFPAEAAYTMSHNTRHITEVLDNQTGPVWFFISKVGTNYGELIYIPLVFVVIRYFKNRKDYKLLSLIIWIFIPLIFFSIAKTKMQAYILFTAPALFLITAFFANYLTEKAINNKHKLINFALAVLLIALPFRYTTERLKPFSKDEKNPEWVSRLKSVKSDLGSKNTLLFNCPFPIEAMFYCDCTAYSSLPNAEKLEEYVTNGYHVIIWMNEGVPAEVIKNKELEILNPVGKF